MSQMSQVKRAMITAVCIALCVVLPMAFHSIQNAGAIFCPMHIPVSYTHLQVGTGGMSPAHIVPIDTEGIVLII